jgi:hypothetical protein
VFDFKLSLFTKNKAAKMQLFFEIMAKVCAFFRTKPVCSLFYWRFLLTKHLFQNRCFATETVRFSNLDQVKARLLKISASTSLSCWHNSSFERLYTYSPISGGRLVF